MWDMEDLLFLCFHRQEEQDAVTFVHFAQPNVEGRAARLTSFGWTEDSHNRTVLEFNLPPLRWPDDTAEAMVWRSQWLCAFDKQRLTEVFFKEYQALFTILQNDFSKQTKDKPWAHDHALQFMNRVMFLYFIQRKRWLGGDPDFLKTFWTAYGNAKQPLDTFFEKWLKVMFFEAFNNRFHGGHEQFPSEIKKALQLAPYLNGGLFEENDLDRKHSFTVNDERFLQVLTFLERYNFTVSQFLARRGLRRGPAGVSSQAMPREDGSGQPVPAILRLGRREHDHRALFPARRAPGVRTGADGAVRHVQGSVRAGPLAGSLRGD